MTRIAKAHEAAPDRSPDLARRSACPVANTLDTLGDRWTLLVIRDLLRGKRRFAEFTASPERIPTNLLSDRLKRLEQAGIVTSRLYRPHPPRSEYLLTPKGEDLGPVVRAMANWGLKYIPGTAEMLLPRLRR